jgi:hypothetical protein
LRMQRRLALLTSVTAVILIGSVTPSYAAAVVPYQSRPLGHTYQTWLRTVGQFFLGDASNPLFAGLEGECGRLVDGVFMMAAPIDLGVQLECEIPAGMPIVLSHAGQFAFRDAGQTDEELQAIVEGLFQFTSNTLTLDGTPLPLKTIDTGAYDVIAESGSFYNAIIGLEPGPVRTVLRANVVFLHPLKVGDHVIEAEAFFTDGESYSATYLLHVG